MHPVFYQFALGLWGILPGNYSGITPVVDNVYAIVDDKESVDGFQYLTLDFNLKNGKLKDAHSLNRWGRNCVAKRARERFVTAKAYATIPTARPFSFQEKKISRFANIDWTAILRAGNCGFHRR